MPQILVIIAIVAAAVLATALAIRAVLARLVGKFGQSVEEMLQAVTLAPPICIHLEPIDAQEPAWRDPERAGRAVASLSSLGYQPAGAYRIRETDLIVQGMASPRDAVFAAVFEHPSGALCIDLATPMPGGGLFTTTTSPATGLPRPGDMPIRYSPPETDPETLHREHLRHRPAGPFEAVRAEDFQPAFEGAYARAMEHVAAVGLTDEHVRTLARSARIDVTSAVVQRTRRAFQMQAEIEVLEALRRRFLDQSGLTASEWESMRDDVVFVHDRMTEDHVIGAYAEALDWEDDEQAETLEFTAEEIARSAPPRDAFARLNRTLPEARAYQRIGEVDGPIPCDVYRQRAA